MVQSSLARQVELTLFDNDVRFTAGRRSVVDALAAAAGPMSAAELHGEVGTRVPLSSLYRTLAVLEDSGVVTHHLGARGLTRYELAEWLTGHHHHLVCIVCGSVTDVEISAAKEERVREMVGEIAELSSFTPTDHSLEIEGRCPKCR